MQCTIHGRRCERHWPEEDRETKHLKQTHKTEQRRKTMDHPGALKKAYMRAGTKLVTMSSATRNWGSHALASSPQGEVQHLCASGQRSREGQNHIASNDEHGSGACTGYQLCVWKWSHKLQHNRAKGALRENMFTLLESTRRRLQCKAAVVWFRYDMAVLRHKCLQTAGTWPSKELAQAMRQRCWSQGPKTSSGRNGQKGTGAVSWQAACGQSLRK